MARLITFGYSLLRGNSISRLSTSSIRALSTTQRHDHQHQEENDEESGDRNTHFGFETVREDQKSQRVYGVFENVAENYDLMNDAMSVGVHRLWKDLFIERLGPMPGMKLLDVAGGTGDITLRFLNALETTNKEEGFMDQRSFTEADEELESIPKNHVTVSDINQAMLDVGKARLDKLDFLNTDISWLRADAEALPLADNSYDVYTIAFGIRNCTHIEKVLDEAYRVLKPGGRFMCLEFSHVNNPLLSTLYDLYSFQAIPVMGQVIAGDYRSYQYLVESIRQFPDQETFCAMIEDAGFRMVTHENLSFGVAAIHSGFKV